MLFANTLLASIALLASGIVAQHNHGENGWSQSGGGGKNAAASWTQSAWASSTGTAGNVLVQIVQVSNSNGSALQYFPEHIRAPPGTWVQFQFQPKNHTATQSTFDNPCVPINNIMPNVTGIKSGFMPVALNSSSPTYSILVNDTNPIWVYCGQTGHCQKGMAMVINEAHGSNKTLQAYKAAAAQVVVPASSSSSSSTSAVAPASSTTQPTAPSAAPATTTTSGGATAPSAFNAAAREVVGMSGLAELLVIGLAFLL